MPPLISPFDFPRSMATGCCCGTNNALRVTFTNVGPGETVSAVVESAVLQSDARQGRLPLAQVVEPAQ